MAIVYQSVGTGAWTGSGSIVVTKPSGLAVGDLMVAIIGNDNGGTANINTLSGWTSYANTIGGGAGEDPRLAIFTKTADSGDVAASNFTFTQTAAVQIVGAILRISNWGFIDQTSVTNFTTAGTLSPITGVTPTRINELLLMIVLSEAPSGADSTYSGYSITTSNPSWTEIFELSDSSETGTLACAVATRPEITATGDASISVGGSPIATTDHIVRIISIAPQVDSAFIVGATKVNAYAPTQTRSVELDAVAENPTFSTHTDTQWTNPDKPSTIWNNPNK